MTDETAAEHMISAAAGPAPAEVPPAGGGEAVAEPAPEPFRTPEALLAERDQEVAVLKDRLLRLQAEFDNFRKRQTRDRVEFLKFANEGVLREFLPIVDNLERAVGSATDEAQPAAIRTGIEMILRLFRTALEKSGVSPLECQGASFDPNTMQAVQQVETPEGPDGVVLEIVQPGYLLEGRVLRPAMVKVSRAARPAGTSAGAADV